MLRGSHVESSSTQSARFEDNHLRENCIKPRNSLESDEPVLTQLEWATCAKIVLGGVKKYSCAIRQRFKSSRFVYSCCFSTTSGPINYYMQCILCIYCITVYHKIPKNFGLITYFIFTWWVKHDCEELDKEKSSLNKLIFAGTPALYG